MNPFSLNLIKHANFFSALILIFDDIDNSKVDIHITIFDMPNSLIIKKKLYIYKRGFNE